MRSCCPEPSDVCPSGVRSTVNCNSPPAVGLQGNPTVNDADVLLRTGRGFSRVSGGPGRHGPALGGSLQPGLTAVGEHNGSSMCVNHEHARNVGHVRQRYTVSVTLHCMM